MSDLEQMFRNIRLDTTYDPSRYDVIVANDHELRFFGEDYVEATSPLAVVPLQKIGSGIMGGFWNDGELVFMKTGLSFNSGDGSHYFSFNKNGDPYPDVEPSPITNYLQVQLSDLEVNTDDGIFPMYSTVTREGDFPVAFLKKQDELYSVGTLLLGADNHFLYWANMVEFGQGMSDLIMQLDNKIYEPSIKPAEESALQITVTEVFEEPKEKGLDGLNPVIVKESLDEYIIGQEKAKRRMATAVTKYLSGYTNHVLLLGETGVGKSEMMKRLGEILDLPYAKSSFTNASQQGYTGNDLQNVLVKLARQVESESPKGIVFVDEVDKLAKKDSMREGIETEILPWLDGDVIDIDPYQYTKNVACGQEVAAWFPNQVDTSGILFVCGGAFHGHGRGQSIDDIIKKRLNLGDTIVGFGERDKQADMQEYIRSKVEKSDIINYGLSPELVGRLHTVLSLWKLKHDELKRILSEKKGNILDSVSIVFEKRGYELIVEDEVLDFIVSNNPPELNARGLETVCSELFDDLIFEAANVAEVQDDGSKVIRVTLELANKIFENE
ncbi:AAA domain-containing protein [Candidatus Woesearchaeota archaeon]|nr:AAA domain-containing protein [Candidatus Woesearchaeota archaeon]